MNGLFWTLYAGFVVFAFGACIGSFLNVCIYRIPRELSVVRPRSACPACGAMIAWYDNIPLVSWALLRARCRHCSVRISARYALVELLTGLLFLFVWLRFGFSLLTPVYMLVLSGLILGTFVDLEHMIIPDRVTLGGIAAGLLLSPLVPALHGTEDRWAAALAAGRGAFAGAGILYAVALAGRWVFKKDAMGLGDVKLLGAIGAFLGVRSVFFTLVASSFAGSIAGIGFILSGNKAWGSRIPFGPYIALAATAWILGADVYWNAYIDWLFARPM